MKRRLGLILSLSYCIFSQGLFLNAATAQVTPDGTTNTAVDVDGNNFTIEQGDRAGDNLFHSFGDFSVPTGGSAFFNNSADIVNIFSRVTGGNISNIDGLLEANGTANLYLINPVGIIFGENARLDIGGSFFGSTADSIVFSDGEFSATDLANPPLLTINAPIGLSFRDNPGDIVNRSDLRETQTIDQGTDSERTIVDRIGLQVNPGNNISLIGGNIFLEDSGITAPGGTVNLGGLSAAGEINFNADGSLIFPEDIARANINLSEGSLVDVAADGGGFIHINAQSLTLSEQSQILAGIAENSGLPGAQAGDIIIDTTGSFIIDGSDVSSQRASDTAIRNNVGFSRGLRDSDSRSIAKGNAGNINIKTNVLEILNAAKISGTTFGEGNAGNIDITAGSLILDNGEINSSVSGAQDDLTRGNAGNINVSASGEIILINNSKLQAQATRNTEGNSGNITINTNSLTGLGLSIFADNQGKGDAGNIRINAADSVVLDSSDRTIDGSRSLILTQLQTNVQGKGGDIEIKAKSLILNNRASLLADTKGEGDAGNITINVQEEFTLDQDSLIIAQVGDNAIRGNAGNIEINTGSLEIVRGAFILANTRGNGNSGSITIQATDKLSLSEGALIRVGVNQDAKGNSGNININTSSLFLSESGISSSTRGQGTTGDIDITANSISLDNFSYISASNTENAIGGAGEIVINSQNITLSNRANINSFTNTNFDAGIIIVNTQNLNLSSGSSIISETNGQGNGGNIDLNVVDRIILDGANAP
ncbi:MAG: filamentous hemagglutinin N-terminal domain-containing protein, partial [Cyanobacteria bacterium P01_F01_bin.143]